MAETKKRAFRAITWYITQFCLTHRFGGQSYGSLRGFNSDAPKVGDLIVPTSSPISEWYLSWLREIDRREHGSIYLLESIETGKLANWSNVGIEYLDRDAVAEHPEWQWTDKQFEFNDRWKRVCFKERDAYITLPLEAEFGDEFAVTLGARTRFSLDDYRPSKQFADWRKVTKKVMAETYDEFVANKPKPIVATPQTGEKTDG